MAVTPEGAALTRLHQRQQLSLRAAVLRDLALLWPLFTGDPATWAVFAAAAAALIQARHRDSAGLAAAYFVRFRAAEGAAGPAGARLAEPPAAGLVAAVLQVAGLAGFYRAVGAGQSQGAARRTALVRVMGGAGRLVLGGGRDTVLRSVQADRAAQGWVRITSGSPCTFCAMLASRGAAYRSERSSRFQSHDHCACSNEPYYEGSEMPAANERYRELWQLAQGTLDAGTSNDALNAFRRYLANPGEE